MKLLLNSEEREAILAIGQAIDGVELPESVVRQLIERHIVGLGDDNCLYFTDLGEQTYVDLYRVGSENHFHNDFEDEFDDELDDDLKAEFDND